MKGWMENGTLIYRICMKAVCNGTLIYRICMKAVCNGTLIYRIYKICRI